MNVGCPVGAGLGILVGMVNGISGWILSWHFGWLAIWCFDGATGRLKGCRFFKWATWAAIAGNNSHIIVVIIVGKNLEWVIAARLSLVD